jgi:hypothetical protein
MVSLVRRLLVALLTGLIVGSLAAPSAAQAASSWSKHAFPFGTELQAVSCSSSSFCAAVGSFTLPDSSVYRAGATFNGSSWSAPKRIHTTSDLSVVSCTSRSFCLAGDEFGQAYAFNGSFWTRTRQWSRGRA